MCLCTQLVYFDNWFWKLLGHFLRLGFGTSLDTLPLVQMWTWFILIVALVQTWTWFIFDSLVQMWTWFILVVDFGTNLETRPLMLCQTGLFLVEYKTAKRTETRRQWSWAHWAPVSLCLIQNFKCVKRPTVIIQLEQIGQTPEFSINYSKALSFYSSFVVGCHHFWYAFFFFFFFSRF